VALGVLDFIDADGVDLTQSPVFQPLGDDVLNGVEHLIPRSSERLDRLFPGKAARPARQKQHVCFRQRAFSIAPRNLLDHDRAAAATVHAPHGVQQEDAKSPQRNELEAPLGELIVPASGLVTARADSGRTPAWPHRYLDALFVRTEPCVLVDKSAMPVASVRIVIS